MMNRLASLGGGGWDDGWSPGGMGKGGTKTHTPGARAIKKVRLIVQLALLLQ